MAEAKPTDTFAKVKIQIPDPQHEKNYYTLDGAGTEDIQNFTSFLAGAAFQLHVSTTKKYKDFVTPFDETQFFVTLQYKGFQACFYYNRKDGDEKLDFLQQWFTEIDNNPEKINAIAQQQKQDIEQAKKEESIRFHQQFRKRQ